jgi:hypothetical protein
MKRLSTILAGSLVFMTLGAVFAVAASGPETDPAIASFVLGATEAPIMTTCVGEDGQTFQQVVGTWAGTSTDGNPSGHDWTLNSKPGGVLVGTVSKPAKFVVDTTTGLGYGTGGFSLKGAGKVTMSGTFTLIIQNTDQQGDAIGRGWVTAAIKHNGNATGDSLIANFAIVLDGVTGGITADIGGSDASIPNLSIEYNNTTCS